MWAPLFLVIYHIWQRLAHNPQGLEAWNVLPRYGKSLFPIFLTTKA